VFAPQALAQHESVLRTDGHDHAEAQRQALQEHRQAGGPEIEDVA